MGFALPSSLLLLIITVAATLAIRSGHREIQARRTRLGLTKSSIQVSLFWPLLLTLITLAAARPFLGSEDVPVSSVGSNILVVLDISKSMLAEDIQPNRLEAAKRKILDLVEMRRKKNLQDKIGIILFAGSAYLLAPPTEDYSVLNTYVHSINTTMISSPGSGLNEAISTALGSLSSIRSHSSHLLLLSDGEDNSLSVDNALWQLQRRGSTLSAIGMGTLTGAPIPMDHVGFIKDESGNMVISKLGEEPLRKLSEGSGGQYSQYTIGDSDLESALKSSKIAKQEDTKLVRQFGERGYFLLIGALIVILYGALSKNRYLLFPILLICFIPKAYCESPYEAAEAYKDGRYGEATETFSKEAQTNPGDFSLLQGLGSAQFKDKKIDQAIESFQKLTSLSKNKDENFTANYNLGNAYLEAAQYEKAIDAYDNALKYIENENRAFTNREIARMRMKKEKEDQQEKDKKDSNETQSSESQSENQKDPKSPPKENSNSDEQKSDQNREAPTPQSTPLKEKPASADKKTSDKASLDEAQAQRWLNSLPDAPVLLKKKTDKVDKQSSQSW